MRPFAALVPVPALAALALTLASPSAGSIHAPATPTTGPNTTVTTVAPATAASTSTTAPRPPVDVVPYLSVAAAPADDAAEQALIARLLATPARHVAAQTASALCVTVPLSAPAVVGLRWERNGTTVREIDPAPREAPGFGDCLVGDGADTGEVANGTYQVTATGAGIATSAAPTLVVGADAVATRLVNNGTEPVCLILVSPRRADRFEAYTLDPALAPGEVARIALAAVDQEVEVYECSAVAEIGDDRADRTFTFVPSAAADQPLFAAS